MKFSVIVQFVCLHLDDFLKTVIILKMRLKTESGATMSGGVSILNVLYTFQHSKVKYKT